DAGDDDIVVACHPSFTSFCRAGGRVGPVSVGSFVALDVGDRVSHRLQVGQFVVGDLDAELVLGLHGDLDHGQRVDVQVVDEGLVGGDLGGLDARDLLDDLGKALEDLGVVSHGGFSFLTGSIDGS